MTTGGEGAARDTAPWRRVALGGAGGMLVGMGLGRFSYTAMVPALIEQGRLTAVEAGRVGMLNLLGFFIGAAISVPLQQRISARIALALAVVGSLLALAASAIPAGLVWLAAWRFLVGITTGITMVLSLTVVAATTPANRRAAGAGIMYAGVGIGILIAGMIVPRLLAFGIDATWTGIAVCGLIATALALWGIAAARNVLPRRMPSAPPTASAWHGPARGALLALAAAHFLFSLSIVPHTLYWVDYLSRGLGLGIDWGGIHWSVVGIMSILGPAIATWLGLKLGTLPALVVSFFALGLGIGAPAVVTSGVVLMASSILFGAQPGLAALLAARVRDLGEAEAMPQLLRGMILANASGAVAGGLVMPWVYGRTGEHGPIFLIGGAAMLLGGLLAWAGRRAGAGA